MSAYAPYRCWPLPSRFDYIDRLTYPGMSLAGRFSPSKLPFTCENLDSVRTWFLGAHPSSHPKRHLDRFSRFCRAYGRYTDQQTDHTTSSVAIGRTSLLKAALLEQHEYSIGSCHDRSPPPFRLRLPCSYLAKSRPQPACLPVTSSPPDSALTL